MSVDQSAVFNPGASPQLLVQTKHPFGLRIIVILMLIQLLAGVIIIAAYFYGVLASQAQLTATMSTLLQSPVQMVYVSVITLLRFFAVIGMWRIRHWAWLLTMALLATSMTLDAINFFLGQPSYTSYVLMAINVVSVFYLNQHEIQELFTAQETTEAQ